jgi:hypothetical protein
MSNTTLHERVTVRDERGNPVLLFTRSVHGIRLAGTVHAVLNPLVCKQLVRIEQDEHGWSVGITCQSPARERDYADGTLVQCDEHAEEYARAFERKPAPRDESREVQPTGLRKWWPRIKRIVR